MAVHHRLAWEPGKGIIGAILNGEVTMQNNLPTATTEQLAELKRRVRARNNELQGFN